MKSRRQLRAWIAPALAVVLCACAVGPNYREPSMPTPATYESVTAAADQSPRSRPLAIEPDLAKWWTQFQDPELDSLVTRALSANLDLQSAVSRIRQARAQEIIAGAAETPGVEATGYDVRLHSNSDPLAGLGGGGSAPGAAVSSTNIKLYSLGFDASWEIDFFGGVRRGVEAARANSAAALWEVRDRQVSVVAEVANDYLGLRATQARIAIVTNSAQHQQDLLTLVAARARTGFVTQLDVNQQRSQFAATRAELPSLEADERAMAHALAVLLGQEPEALSAELTADAALPTVPVELPVGLPSDLLRRRPDVREAERRLAAATAQIGVAVSDLYPKFNLIGAALVASNSLGSLISSNNINEALLGEITWPILEGGKVRGGIRIAEEQRQQSYLAYQKAVLTALTDAEDALARYTADQRRLVALEESASAASSSANIASAQYRTGFVTFINVLNSTNALLNAQDQVIQTRQALARDLVSVYKALGGGWDPAASGH